MKESIILVASISNECRDNANAVSDVLTLKAGY
jgi:hypothetical protein